MFSIRVILNIILAIILLVSNAYINEISKSDPKLCPCASGWRITNGKLISSFLFFISIANIFVPVNSFISQIPLIGSGGILIYMLMLSVLIYILNSISRQLDTPECKDCSNVNGFAGFKKILSGQSMTNLMIFSISASIILFYV
jgi:hypothetical protein